MKRRIWQGIGIVLIGVVVLLAGLSYGLARSPSLRAWANELGFYRPLMSQVNHWQRAYADRGEKACLAELAQMDVDFRPPRPVNGPDWCGINAGVRLTRIGSAALDNAPPLSCSMARALAEWQINAVQPLAQQILGSEVRRILQFGTYNCRAIRGNQVGFASQHSFVNALDVGGFKLANGQTISILHDWDAGSSKAQQARSTFLHQVSAQACDHFSVMLSPDYNALHRDHLHLDQGFLSRCSTP
jgi:hypothetical protein